MVCWVGSLAGFCACSSGAIPSPASSELETPTPEVVRRLADSLRERAPSQARILRDGSVTDDEYNSALSELERCFRNGGVQFSEPVWDPVSGTGMTFFVESNEEKSDACRRAHWDEVDAVRRSLATPHMAGALLVEAKKCLLDRGQFVPPHATSFNELVGIPNSMAIPEDGPPAVEAAKDCVLQELVLLYPGDTQFSWR